MFMQGEAPIERSGTGLGIGLALVKNLVEMHMGTVEAHSAGVGRGSEFVVRLPVTQVAQPQPIAPSHESLAARTARRILVVDDNRDAAASLAMFLKLSGHDTHIAHDGLEAVEKAAQLAPDVILLDIGLPKISGLEAARRIRAQSQGKRPVLVALTGWAHDADRQNSREAGFNAHVVKPVDLDVLANLLMEFPAVGCIP
jgi:two-component system, chemotaxis family, CheB/CheR fusion protein